jgi:hypothetical protein
MHICTSESGFSCDSVRVHAKLTLELEHLLLF